LPFVEPGAAVAVAVIAWPGKLFAGRVEWISATLDPALRTARVRCSLDNPGGQLKPEMSALLSIARPPRRALAVPAKAVQMVNDQPVAFVATGRTAHDGRGIFRRQLLRLAGEHAQRGPRRGEPLVEMRLRPPSEEELVPVADGLKAGGQVLVQQTQPRETGGAEAAISTQQLEAAGILVETAAL